MAFHEIQWYDRNPLSVHSHTHFSTGPHIGTSEITYTVPKGRKAMLEVVQIKILRLTVAAPASNVWAYLVITTGGDSSTILMAMLFTNNVGDTDKAEIQGNIALNEGETLTFWTLDESTGGTVRYFLSYKVTEFDPYIYEYPPKTLPTPIIIPEDHPQEPGLKPDPEM